MRPVVSAVDWVALQQLFATCAAAQDDHDTEAFLACFTPDAVIGHIGTDPVTGGDLGRQQGREQIRRARDQIDVAPTRRHVITNLRVIQQDDDGFITEQVVLVAGALEHDCALLRIANYTDRVVRGADGMLRISERTIAFAEPAGESAAAPVPPWPTLEELGARAGVEAALFRYGHGITRKDRTLWLDAFSEEAHLTIAYLGAREPAVDLTGIGQLARWYDEHERDWPAGTETQLTVAPQVTVDGDRAHAESIFVVAMTDPAGTPSTRTLGTYEDELHRCSDGQWRIDQRRVTTSTRKVDNARGGADAAL